jgi:proline iminopeptidase
MPLLPTPDANLLHYEVHGSPSGTPVLALHGGPGGGNIRGLPRMFDPTRFRLVQVDQRGCGGSTPHAGDWATSLATNTTHHLVADIERLREHLGIERWLVWGGSWGVTLALAYAERFPERVSGMILLSVTLTRRCDVEWFGRGVRRFLPGEWERFRAGVPEAERDGDLVAAYDRLLNAHPDPAVRLQAARDWVAWEDALLSREARPVSATRWADEAYMIAFARLVTHYFANAAFLGEDELLRNAGRLAGIPGVLLHGRLDLSCPPDGAWALAKAWPGAELHLVGGGHLGDAEMDRLHHEAIARFG